MAISNRHRHAAGPSRCFRPSSMQPFYDITPYHARFDSTCAIPFVWPTIRLAKHAHRARVGGKPSDKSMHRPLYKLMHLRSASQRGRSVEGATENRSSADRLPERIWDMSKHMQ
jgi:hypothetical protein